MSTIADRLKQKALNAAGGKDKIRRRWQCALREGLGGLNGQQRSYLEEYLFPEKEQGFLKRLTEDEETITTAVFNKLGCALHVSPAEFILIEEDLDTEKWRREIQQSGARVVGVTGGPSGRLPELTVEAYIVLRVLEALDE